MNQFMKRVIEPVRRHGRYYREFYRHRTARICPRPVLIGGSQKSGTTVIGVLLAKATGSRYSNDPFWHAVRYDSPRYLLPELLDNRLAVDDFIARHRAYFAAEIVKSPDFAYLFPQLRACFPQSQQVFIVRDPRRNIRSILNRLHIPGNLDELGDEHRQRVADKPIWHGILEGAGMGPIQGNYVARLAQRWNLGAQCYLEQRDRVHLLRYEDFQADKVGCIEDLASTLGMEVVADIDADKDRQFQPAGDHSTSLLGFFGKRNLAAIEALCGERMAAFGYT